jgi:hypothetical protein
MMNYGFNPKVNTSPYVEHDEFSTLYRPDLSDVLGATMEDAMVHNQLPLHSGCLTQ